MSDQTKRTVRTAFQALVGACAVIPLVIAALAGILPTTGAVAAAVAAMTAVATGVTRVMAMPEVDGYIKRFAPWLALTD